MKTLTPERPPIADHPIWQEIRYWINPQHNSQNASRWPLWSDTPVDLVRRALALQLVCVCGNMFYPFRRDRGHNGVTMYLTGRGHKQDYGCCSRPVVRLWSQWLRVDLQKVRDVMVQESFL